MKIKYSILWIDDEALTDEIERVERHLRDIGFVPFIDKKDTADERGIDFHKYNLILLDYQLNNSKTTKEILEKIREKDYYSEIIFYSVKDNFEGYIKDNLDKFEGVFWCDERGNKLHKKIVNVIDLTIKKFQDLNNLRGLVMAETSDLDKLKKQVFHKYFKLNNKDQEKVKKHIIDTIEESLLSNFKKIKKYKGKKIEKVEEAELTEGFDKDIFDLIEDLIFDMDKKGRCISKVLQAIDSKVVFDCDDYKREILEKRNHLAHSPEEERGESIFFGPFEFSEEECKNLREKIMGYKKILNQIEDEIDDLSKKSK